MQATIDPARFVRDGVWLRVLSFSELFCQPGIFRLQMPPPYFSRLDSSHVCGAPVRASLPDADFFQEDTPLRSLFQRTGQATGKRF